MDNGYKRAMNKLVLDEDTKERILENVINQKKSNKKYVGAYSIAAGILLVLALSITFKYGYFKNKTDYHNFAAVADESGGLAQKAAPENEKLKENRLYSDFDREKAELDESSATPESNSVAIADEESARGEESENIRIEKTDSIDFSLKKNEKMYKEDKKTIIIESVDNMAQNARWEENGEMYQAFCKTPVAVKEMLEFIKNY